MEAGPDPSTHKRPRTDDPAPTLPPPVTPTSTAGPPAPSPLRSAPALPTPETPTPSLPTSSETPPIVSTPTIPPPETQNPPLSSAEATLTQSAHRQEEASGNDQPMIEFDTSIPPEGMVDRIITTFPAEEWGSDRVWRDPSKPLAPKRSSAPPKPSPQHPDLVKSLRKVAAAEANLGFDELKTKLALDLIKKKKKEQSIEKKLSTAELSLIQELASEAKGSITTPQTEWLHVIVAMNATTTREELIEIFGAYDSLSQDNTVTSQRDDVAIIAFADPEDRKEALATTKELFPTWKIVDIEKLKDTDCAPNSLHVAHIKSSVVTIEHVSELTKKPIRRFTSNNGNVTVSFFREEDLEEFLDLKRIKVGGRPYRIGRSYIGTEPIKLILRKIPQHAKTRMVKSWLEAASCHPTKIELSLNENGGSRGHAWIHFETLAHKTDALQKRVYTDQAKLLEWGDPDTYEKPKRGRPRQK